MDKLKMKSKVCLVGDLAVGKTSLIRRFVQNAFDDKYLTTLGTKVSKKSVEVALPEPVQLDMMIWDIMGQHAFQELLKDSYFFGVRGILAVADLTRRDTLEDIELWVENVESVAGKVPMVLVVNKADLEPRAAITRQDIEATAKRFGCDFLLASAKTGQNIEEAFARLGKLVAQHQIGSPEEPF